MSEDQRQHWEEARKRGEAFYCFRNALLAGGTTLAVQAYFGVHVHHLPIDKFLLKSLEPTFVGMFGGFVTGIWEWSSNEDRYLRSAKHLGSINEISLNGSDCSMRGTLNGNRL